MEATGVYWIVPHDVLEQAGLQVVVVNGAHVKNLPGRKSDMSDPQWLAELQAHGLLGAGFVPEEAVRRLRDYQRLRQDHIQMGSAHILHMQKALDRMNLKIHEVISQITGWSGQRMIEAILAGERDPEKLASLCDEQILEKKRSRVIEALHGFWRPEHLFALRQAWEGWQFYQRQIRACDKEIAQILADITPAKPQKPPGPLSSSPSESKAGRKKKRGGKRMHHNAPEIPQLHQALLRLAAVKTPRTCPR